MVAFRCCRFGVQKFGNTRGRQRQDKVDRATLRRQCVGDGIGYADRRRHAVALSDTFGTGQRQRRRRFDMQDIQGRDFQNGRHRIIREGACQKGAVRTVGELFEQRCADRLRESAANLSFDHAGMQNASTVMHSNITVDPNLTGDRVDLYTTKIKDKGMTQRGVDPILASRCRQFFGRPDRCFTNYGVHIVGQRSRSPMAGRGDTRKGYAGFRVAIQMYAPSGKDDIFRPAVQLPRSDPREAMAQSVGGKLHCRKSGGCKPAGIVAGGDGPGILGGIKFGNNPDIFGAKSQNTAHQFRRYRLVPLSLRHAVYLHSHRSHWIQRDRSCSMCAVFRARFGALRRRQRRGKIAHVRNRRLDCGSQADAIDPPRGARQITSRQQLAITAVIQCNIEGADIIARVIRGSAGCPVGKRTNQVAAYDVKRIKFQFLGDPLH